MKFQQVTAETAIGRNEFRSSGSLEHLVDNVSKPHSRSSPFTNCEGAEDREYVTEICETARCFCESDRTEGPVKEACGREFKKETCRTEPLRDALRKRKGKKKKKKPSQDEHPREWLLRNSPTSSTHVRDVVYRSSNSSDYAYANSLQQISSMQFRIGSGHESAVSFKQTFPFRSFCFLPWMAKQKIAQPR